MELGAVVVVQANGDNRTIHNTQFRVKPISENPLRLCSSRMPILGNDVLQSWAERVRELGVRKLWLTFGPLTSSPLTCNDKNDQNNYESAAWSGLRGLFRQGVERLLTITLSSYAEMDLTDLLRFHCEKGNPVTEAQDSQGQLGVCLLDRRALPPDINDQKSASVSDDFRRIPYQFLGYSKRILSARERQELVDDALTGACALRPFGKQIRDQVWIGEDVNLADSARVIGPTYIGARTVVRAGATIGPFASVERDCVVDCGTTVERSTVLPYSYLAPGLLIRHSEVDGRHLEDLGRGVIVDLQPAGLGHRIKPRESRRHDRSETNIFSRAFARDSAPSSRTPQPWIQVEL